jgi:hypothetical protein
LIWVGFQSIWVGFFEGSNTHPHKTPYYRRNKRPKAVEAGIQRAKVVTTADGQATGLGFPLSAVPFPPPRETESALGWKKVCSARSFSASRREPSAIRPGECARIGPRPPVPDHFPGLAQFQSGDKKIPGRRSRTRRAEHHECESNVRIQTLRQRERLRWQEPKVARFPKENGQNGDFEKRGYYPIDSAAVADLRGRSMCMPRQHPSRQKALPEAAQEGGYTN